MNKYTLITSPTNHHRKDYKYLSYGCLSLFQEKYKKNIIQNHPWNNKKKYLNDAVKIKKIYSYVLRKIAKSLNENHKINKDLRYWKIIIGPWLHTFLASYYEKNLSVDILLKKKQKIIIPIVNFKNENQIPDSFFTFFSKNIYASSWNDHLFKLIISKKKIGKNFSFKKKIYKNFKESKKKMNKSYVKTLQKILLSLTNLIFFPLIKKQPLVFFNSYLSLKNKLFLIFKNLSLPIYFNEEKKFVYPDTFLRESLIKKFKKNDINTEILKLSLLNIPTDFLENFNYIGKKISKLNIPKKPKVILTANGIYGSSFEARYIAECISNGTKLILAQHGGRYENLKDFFHLNHEVDISDFFIGWGGKKNNIKIKNLGIIKPIKIFKKDNRKKNNILFLMLARGRYLRTIDSEINLKNLFYYYHEICPNFYDSLKNNIKKNLIYRSSINNYWNEKEFLEKKNAFCKIDFNRHKSNLFNEARESKVVVCSYFSTTFLELMSANIPVILFTPFNNESYNTETLKAFSEMKKNFIFFNNYKNAAKFINKNWNDIDNWWYSKKTQKTRKYFLNKFSKYNQQLIFDIQTLINNLTKIK